MPHFCRRHGRRRSCRSHGWWEAGWCRYCRRCGLRQPADHLLHIALLRLHSQLVGISNRIRFGSLRLVHFLVHPQTFFVQFRSGISRGLCFGRILCGFVLFQIGQQSGVLRSGGCNQSFRAQAAHCIDAVQVAFTGAVRFQILQFHLHRLLPLSELSVHFLHTLQLVHLARGLAVLDVQLPFLLPFLDFQLFGFQPRVQF